jgi:hypothetical protein
MSLLNGANPMAGSGNYSQNITGTAQGMPTPKNYGSYTAGPQTNQFGSWGGAAETGIPGDINGSPQGAPSGEGQNWGIGAPPAPTTPAATSASSSGGSGAYSIGGSYNSPFGPPQTSLPANAGDYMAFDDGGAIPDPGDAIPSDPSDNSDMSDFSDTGSGDQEGQQLMSTIYQVLDYGRQKNGLSSDAFQQAFNQPPSKPAGPGGDQPNTNPFPTKTPVTPFGTKTSSSGDSDGDQDDTENA